MQTFFREIRIAWKKQRFVKYLQKQKLICLTYQLGYFLRMKYKHKYIVVRVGGKIKDYFDIFETDFWLDKEVCFREHNAAFIAQLFSRNLNDFELDKE